MGLDITAYTQLSPAPSAEVDSDGNPVDYNTHVRLRENADFPGRMAGLTDGGIYTYADSMSFRAGSYGGYNGWRDALAKLAGYPEEEYDRFGGEVKAKSHAAACGHGAVGPFSELINFSDCEGVIGPEVSKKLARDFAEWDERAKAADDGFFYDRYRHWRKAFEMAANGGAVDFH